MDAHIRSFIVLFCIVYAVLWFVVEDEDVKRVAVGEDASAVKRVEAPGLTDDIFDQCKLVNGPLWTDYLKKWLKPNDDPMKSCNHSFVPWSELGPDGRVRLTEAWPEEADCRARAVLLKSEFKTTLGEWYEIREEFVFEKDIVEVECDIDDVIVYNYLHTQVWRKESKKKQPRNSRRGNARKAPSVHILVLDSIGASHGRRVFNQTHRYLKEEFGAVEMQHVNKVGENSRPNGIAFLFGKLISYINRDIYGLPSIPADWNRNVFCKSFLDDKGFILKAFEKSGYVTMMAEDWAMGVFNWPSCNGFQNQPTTHYMRPFQLRFKKGGKLKGTMGSGNCFESHLMLNDYQEKFINAYPDSPKASLTWASNLGHDQPNPPFHADVQYRQFFERNKEEFDNSFVFFMGDHGLRFGWYNQDPIGRRDNNNPMMVMSVPRWLREDPNLMANLERNSGELLTHFDTHATFVDIVETFSTKTAHNFNKTVLNPQLKGSSVLRPLPAGPRNCKTLPIPPSYCICEIERELLNITSEHAAIGHSVAAEANDRLAEANATDVCAELELDKLKSLKRLVGGNNLYEVTVQLRPGGGVFQTFVRGSDGDFSVVVPRVTRLNIYGNQGDCTKNNEIRPMCYCKDNFLQKPQTSTSPPE